MRGFKYSAITWFVLYVQVPVWAIIGRNFNFPVVIPGDVQADLMLVTFSHILDL